MTTRAATTLVLILLTAATLAGLLLWERLPDPMASHWNIDDQVDGYMPRTGGVFLMPLISLGLAVLLLIIPAIDPLRANLVPFRPVLNLFVVLLVAFQLYIQGLTLAWNLGYRGFRISAAMLPAVGLLLVAIGWMMKRAKRNFFIGIRTPWTLSSDAVWDETHRLGARLFVLSGVLAFLGGFLGGRVAFWILLVPTGGSTLFLLLYSYILYRREAQS